MSRDIEARKAYQKAYRAAHQERLQHYHQHYYDTNKDTILQQQHDAYWETRDERVEARRNRPDREEHLAQRRATRDTNKDEENAKQQAIRAADREHARLLARASYQRHQDKRIEASRLRREADPAHAKDIANRSHAKHRDAINQRKRARRQANPEATRAEYQAYKATHREQMLMSKRLSEHKRRAQRQGAPQNDLTRADWEMIKAHYGHRCVYCGRQMERLTMDHIIPLSRGGSHTRSNVVPACKSCNCKKYTGPPLVPVQPLLP